MHYTGDLGRLVQRFWEIDELPSETNVVVKPEEKNATDIVARSLTHKNGHYCVGIHWKPDRHKLPDNYHMAVRRLENIEKLLFKSPKVAILYDDVLVKYK